MAGKPLEHARKACELIVKNLRIEDYFSVVIFDSEAQVVIPLQQVKSKGRHDSGDTANSGTQAART